MSIVRIITVKCDLCGRETEGDWTVSEARETARDDGWRRRRSTGAGFVGFDTAWLDLCDACVDPEPILTEGDAQ
jgi:hypothetical protein